MKIDMRCMTITGPLLCLILLSSLFPLGAGAQNRGAAHCAYRIPQNKISAGALQLTFTIEVGYDTKIVEICNEVEITPAATSITVTQSPDNKSIDVVIAWNTGITNGTMVDLFITLNQNGTICNNTQGIKDVQWVRGGEVVDADLPDHTWRIFPRVTNGGCNIHPFALKNDETSIPNVYVTNLSFNYSSNATKDSLLMTKGSTSDFWISGIYKDSKNRPGDTDFTLLPSDSSCGDITYNQQLVPGKPHIHGYYKIKRGVTGTNVDCWFHHYDSERVWFLVHALSDRVLAVNDRFAPPDHIEAPIRWDPPGSDELEFKINTSLFCIDSPQENSRPEGRLHVKAEYVGPQNPPWGPKPQYLFGPSLEGDHGTYLYDDGVWTVIEADTLPLGSDCAYPYIVDLNDSLFTRGYVIEYYLESDDGLVSTFFPEGAPYGEYLEATCLPLGNSDILFVNDSNSETGDVQTYFESAFSAVLPPENMPDRFDVVAPAELASNGLGACASVDHLLTAYKTIIWDSGDLQSGTITDGTAETDMSDDCSLLIDWMNMSEEDVGLWILGSNVASNLAELSSLQAHTLLEKCGIAPWSSCYYAESGEATANPLVTGTFSGIFGSSLEFFFSDLCECYRCYDVLEKFGTGEYALSYPDIGGSPYYAGIQSAWTNDTGHTVRTMWFGSSFMNITGQDMPAVRNQVLNDVMTWMGHITNPDITEDETPLVNRLSQCYPNPFNPTTTIKFDIREKGQVQLRIYNVAGQLMKTLVDEIREAGAYNVQWDGTNERGIKVASGVYLYSLEFKDFKQTRKMTLLR